MSHELVEAALAALTGNAMTYERALGGEVRPVAGLYALHGDASTWQELGLGRPAGGRPPLYVGKAEKSLVSRDLRTHFATGKTGRSSPRRSFAALLRKADRLDLVARPRRWPDPEPSKWTHYALDQAGDEDLTNWMRRELRIAVWQSPDGTSLGEVEREVVRALNPPLNLTYARSDLAAEVRRARRAMVAEARRWAPSLGRDV